MNTELQELYNVVVTNPYFVPVVLALIALIVIVVVFRKEKGTRGLLEGAAKLAVQRAKEKGLTVEEIYQETIARVEETISKRIEGKNLYRRLLGKCAISWVKSKYIKGIITDFIRAKIQELEK